MPEGDGWAYARDDPMTAWHPYMAFYCHDLAASQ